MSGTASAKRFSCSVDCLPRVWELRTVLTLFCCLRSSLSLLQRLLFSLCYLRLQRPCDTGGYAVPRDEMRCRMACLLVTSMMLWGRGCFADRSPDSGEADRGQSALGSDGPCRLPGVVKRVSLRRTL